MKVTFVLCDCRSPLLLKLKSKIFQESLCLENIRNGKMLLSKYTDSQYWGWLSFYMHQFQKLHQVYIEQKKIKQSLYLEIEVLFSNWIEQNGLSDTVCCSTHINKDTEKIVVTWKISKAIEHILLPEFKDSRHIIKNKIVVQNED